MTQEPKLEVFFGDDDLIERFAAKCDEAPDGAERPHLARVINAAFPFAVFDGDAYAKIALQEGEAVALICALHAYHFTICQSGHLRWLDQRSEILHKRMLDALDATQLSMIDCGMDVRNIMNRALRWKKKSKSLDEDDYHERLAIQDARYLTISSEWMSLLDKEIGRVFFGAQ